MVRRIADAGWRDRGSRDDLVDEILRQFPLDDVDEEAVRCAFPDLPDDVWMEVENAVAIRRAQRLAADVPSTAEEDLDHVLTDDEVEFLRHQIPEYTFIQLLGRGGQAVVYKAVQESTQRIVAVKLLREGPLANSSQRTRFIREINLVSQLHHPHIARIYESGVLRGHYWFSMECIPEGEPIDDYVLLNQPDVQSVVRLIITVARAIGHAHQQGVIHRDIKPSNILVDRDEQPHVVDFGLAKEIEAGGGETRVSQEGHFIGTLPYLSPEQVADNGSRADVRSDVYALGLVLYQLVTGSYPYEITESPFATRDHILHTEPARPRRMQASCREAGTLVPAGEISIDLERIILRAMAKDRERRYQTMFEFAADLERYDRGEAIAARADEYWYNLHKVLRRYRTHVTVAAAFFVVLSISLVFSITLWRRAERIAHIAQAGLDAVAYNALGTRERDAGREDEAIGLFQQALRIGETTDLHDPVLLAARFDSIYRLAWRNYQDEDFVEGDRMRELAARSLERGRRDFPDDPYWASRQASFHLLSGLRFENLEQRFSALAEFQRAGDIDRQLMLAHPSETGLSRNLALSLRRVGRCQLDLKCHEDAQASFEESIAISERLFQRTFNSTDDWLSMIRCQYQLAKCVQRRNSPADKMAAIELLNQAMHSLATLEYRRPDHGLEKNTSALWHDMTELHKYIRSRLSRDLR